MNEEAGARALAEWETVTTPVTRIVGNGKRTRREQEFRHLSGIAVWTEWKSGALWVMRFERVTPEPTGSAIPVLQKLQEIADRHGIILRGNALAIATAECQDPDQGRLVAFYRGAGFSVGPSPSYQMHYPPVSDVIPAAT